VLPLAIFAGLLGLLWYWGSRPSVHAGREEGGVTAPVARPETGYKPNVMASFDTLKTKYQSILDVARDQGVTISSLDQQDGKLVVKGTAPSLEAANKVWDEIKRVNPGMDDIIADFPISSSSVSTEARKNRPPRQKALQSAELKHTLLNLETRCPASVSTSTAARGNTCRSLTRTRNC
jgi:hypothetical protein